MKANHAAFAENQSKFAIIWNKRSIYKIGPQKKIQISGCIPGLFLDEKLLFFALHQASDCTELSFQSQQQAKKEENTHQQRQP